MIRSTALFLLLGVLPASGATYYVDPSGGSDANFGTTPETAWKHIPGSYKSDNTGYVAPVAGWARPSAGDVIYIKSGSVITNRLVATTSWWRRGTADLPITLTRSTNWGSGPVVWDMTKQKQGANEPSLYFNSIDYLTLDGVSPGGFVVSNSPTLGVQFFGSNPTNQTPGLIARNLKTISVTNVAVMFYNQTNYWAEAIEVDGSHISPSCGGIWNGMWAPEYNCDNGILTNCFVHDVGDTSRYSQWGGASYNIGFWSCNIRNVKFIDCVSSNNVGDGYDLGGKARAGVPISDNVYYIRCKSFRNRGDGFGANFNDVATWNLSDTNIGRYYYLSCLAVSNISGINAYNGPWVYAYHCTFAFNQYGMLIDGGQYDATHPYTNRYTMGVVKNTVFFQNNSFGGSNVGDLVSSSTNIVSDLDYNLYDQGTGSQKMVRWNFNGYAGVYKSYFYSTGATAGIAQWQLDTKLDTHSNDSAFLKKRANFVNSLVWPYDFHLQTDSQARRAGVDLSTVWPAGVPMVDIEDKPIVSWNLGAYQSEDRPQAPSSLRRLDPAE